MSALLSPEVCAAIDRWVAKFPPEHKQSAVLAALREVQHANGGYLTTELMDAIAEYLEIPPVTVYEAATFYSMLEVKPVGRHSVSVCTNISCMLRGSDEIMAHIQRKLGIKPGESTADGKFFLKQEEECLAACAFAPMMQIDHVYYENLTPKRVDQILENLEPHHGE